MSSFHSHSEHGRHNLTFLDSFFLKRFNDWAVTVMFYAGVHMVEAILDKEHSTHCQNHQERSDKIAKLTDFPTKAYKALEREARNSRYKSYKIYDWEVHRLFKDDFRKLAQWFNSQVEKDSILDIQSCENLDGEWYEKYRAKDPECNKCH